MADVETPPHAWGRRNWFDCTATALRNTPTCVGKTGNRVMSILRRWKHPHMRGEDPLRGRWAWSSWETPPHAWGRRRECHRNENICGNTPTCVGKTSKLHAVSQATGKHPHMRGEDRRNIPSKLRKLETPPHAWGRHITRKITIDNRGNTPTCVGKTDYTRWMSAHIQKHPHMRGEDSESMSVFYYKRETPPHAWGRHSDYLYFDMAERNTPTCVGKTLNDH